MGEQEEEGAKADATATLTLDEIVAMGKSSGISFDGLNLDDAMEKAWNARDKWKEMGQVAHNRIMRRYSKDAGAELYNIIFGE